MKRSLFPLLIALFSLGVWADDGKLGGTLVDGVWGIRALDLSTGSHRDLVRWPYRYVTGLSRIDSHRLLVSHSLRKPGGRDWLAIYDLRSKELRDLMEGSRGVYMPERGLIAYYTGYAGKYLRLADLSGNAVGVVDMEGTGYAFPVVPVSGSAFVYESLRSGAHGIWLHDLETGESEQLPGLRHCSLHHAVWRRVVGELLCPERLSDGQYTGNYVLATLDGGNRRVDDFGAGRLRSGSFWPVAYLEHLDALVVQERTASLWRGEYHPLHVYRFSDESKVQVAENMYVGPVVYMAPGTLENLISGAPLNGGE